MNRFFTLVVLLPTLLFSSDSSKTFENDILNSAHNPLSSFLGAPETNIYGVNVINGDYSCASIDFELPGADPLIFQRSYSSSNFASRGFYNSWTHNHTGLVNAYTSKEHLYIISTGSVSCELPFKKKTRNPYQNGHTVKLNQSILRKGVTNCGQSEISGRTNIKNMTAYNFSDAIAITSADGSEHSYRRVEGDNTGSINYLYRSDKPNGLITFYHTEGYILQSVENQTKNNNIASNKIEFSTPAEYTFKHFNKTKKPLSIKAVSADNKTADYTLDFHKHHSDCHSQNNILLSKFESNHLPNEYYRYTNSEDGPEKLENKEGEHHRTRVHYYKKGDRINFIDYGVREVTSDHVARDRVMQIDVAVNNLGDLQTVFKFSYFKDKFIGKTFTDVYNQYNHLSRYHYSIKNYRLECIERFKADPSFSVYCRERFKYGTEETLNDSNLLFRTLEEFNGTIHYGESYSYDERGNALIKNTHYRSLRDFSIHPISNDGSKLHGGEVKSVHYTYNDMHLVTSEDDGKLKVLIRYHTRNDKKINLLESKFYQENGVTRRREFHDFDQNLGCNLLIVDDGSGVSRDDLTGIRSRKVTRMHNRDETFAGLPLEIDVFGLKPSGECRISRTLLNYDSHGYVDKEVHFDANNHFAYEIHKIRDIQGNIVTQTDALGQTTHRKFNLYHSLLEEHGPSPDYFMEYSYDFLQRPTKATRKCSDGIDLTSSTSYDLEGKVTKSVDPYGFTTEYVYNEQGRPIEIIHPMGRTNKGAWVRAHEFKEYDFMGNLVSETGPSGAVTRYVRNDAGWPLKITYPDGTNEQFRYSMHGEVLEKCQRNGSKVLYWYDAFSRVLSEKIYDQYGNFLKEMTKEYSGLLLLSETDASGLQTTYGYDHADRVTEIWAGNAYAKNIYDALGRLQEERRYFANGSQDYLATVYTYDLLNRVTDKDEVDGQGKTHSKTSTSYDADGNVLCTTSLSHAGAGTDVNTYDQRGNLSSTTDALGNTTLYHHRYDFFMDGINLPCLEEIDPTGVKTITISDSKGSVLNSKTYAPNGKLLSEVEMFYDIQGNLVRKKHHLEQEIIVTLYDYDAASRLVRQINGAGTEEQITTLFSFNSRGELSKTKYSNGSSKHYAYDAIGRLSEEWSDGKSLHYSYSYNQQDLPTIVTNCVTGKKTERKYSREGNLLSERFENGLKICYAYDKINRIIQCTYPDGSSVQQFYNPFFLNKVERIKNGNVVYETSFDAFDLAGKPKLVHFPKNSGILSLDYDLLDRPVSLASTHYNEDQIMYDARGLLVSKIVNSDSQIYKHDYLQQLTLEKTGKYSHTYKNDALNRQILVDGFKQTHNAVHQLTKGEHGVYNFDKKGRRVQDDDTRFRYDKFDRLVEVKKGHLVWNYTYDAFNRKMSRTFSDEAICYLYDGYEEIGSYDVNKKNLDLKVLSSSEGSLPIAIELKNKIYAPLISTQGHIVGLVEANTGVLADESPLKMFGQDLAENPLSPWRFCGKRHEDAFGIVDFGFRFYHPKSAQWLTQDPLGESDGPNLYAYVSNHPTCCIDRYGLFMDNFSFSSSWSGFKDNCCWAGNQVADYTINSPRFHGLTRAVGGFGDMTIGLGLATGGSLGTGGAGAPLAIPVGCCIFINGADNFSTGLNQFYTGREQKTLSAQLLEKAGLSEGSAGQISDNLSMGGRFTKNVLNVAKNGTKIGSDVVSKVTSYLGKNTKCNKASKQRNKPPSPDARAEGRPHSIIERPGRDGQYTTHYGNGTYKQYRGSGKPHGDIARPNIKESKVNVHPINGLIRYGELVREVEPWEIPINY